MKYFVSLFLSLFFLVFISCGNEDNAWDNNIPIITSNVFITIEQPKLIRNIRV